MASNLELEIHLGAANMVVACSDPTKDPSVVDIRNSRASPLVVSFCEETVTVVNQANPDPSVSEPSRTIRMVKRLMRLSIEEFDRDFDCYSILHYEVVPDKEENSIANAPKFCVSAEFRVKRQLFRPVAMIRSELVFMYNLYKNGPHLIVIGVLAYFDTVARVQRWQRESPQE